jgi:hypothetical protein
MRLNSIMAGLLLAFLALPGLLHAEEREGIRLPGDLRLNGKFDLAYERVGYTDKIQDGNDSLRNYHRFIFLSYREREKPYFFTADIVDRNFYEFGARYRRGESPWNFSARAGKVLVPFGAEPLFHNTYGGLSGFDQPVLPIIWAQHGLTVKAVYRWQGLSLSNDTYGIQGYTLSAPDAVLNLQADLSPADNVKFGLGNRLGLSWGPIAAWYSTYFNDMSFGRRLFMQALDVSIWRLADVPVIRDFALGAGILRADVSGGVGDLGGPGDDYYHFANYLELRYHPLAWLYLQARTGLRTFDNRRGFHTDDDRLTNRDGTAHNIGIVYKNGGYMVALHHYWNLEKVDEIDNDFLRLRVGYEF